MEFTDRPDLRGKFLTTMEGILKIRVWTDDGTFTGGKEPAVAVLKKSAVAVGNVALFASAVVFHGKLSLTLIQSRKPSNITDFR